MDPIQIIIEGLLAIVVGAVGFIVRGLASDIRGFGATLDRNAQKMSALEVLMMKDFALKTDLIPINARMAELLGREEMVMLRNQVQKNSNDIALLMASADLHRRKGET